ncbi:L domain-like protein [Rhizoclosmatium globosum]|uniref:L domain-like protein n=1 Tax=Rhizoclosmatium globosum TaxID=329046 RepID=A0A1Y2AML2_9FUNG|nr:L domain-like protein [Rhizoclosmatium globosum]|eukprot:ORY23185.1 L domain-like protein [Rhizoclosmatium globosum]
MTPPPPPPTPTSTTPSNSSNQDIVHLLESNQRILHHHSLVLQTIVTLLESQHSEIKSLIESRRSEIGFESRSLSLQLRRLQHPFHVFRVCLGDVPDDVLASILGHVHPRSVFALARTSRRFKRVLEGPLFAALSVARFTNTNEEEAEMLELERIFFLAPNKWQSKFANTCLSKKTEISWGMDSDAVFRIPPSIRLLDRLVTLQLSGIQGTIPKEIGALVSLQDLDLSRNALSGPIPPEIGHLRNLKRIQLHHCNLSGSIPPEIGDLVKLTHLSFNNNKLTGTIPKELGMLKELRDFRLAFNQLTGTIPRELGQLTNLTWFSLRDNRLTGPIPPELGNLRKLQSLFLYDNQLSGRIPREFLKLVSLEECDCTGNQGLVLDFDMPVVQI